MKEITEEKDDLGQLLEAARSWLEEGHRVAIATVIETWGSAPRRVGAHLLICDDGRFEGSVSGGCVEGDVLTEAQSLLNEPGFLRLDYGVADSTAWKIGLACGGRISVLVQSIAPHFFGVALLGRMVAARKEGIALTLSTDLASGRTIEVVARIEGNFNFVYEPALRVAIVGAVHIAQFLAPICRLLGHAPTIIDPRGLFAQDSRFSGIPIDDRWPDEALDAWAPNRASAIIALTHDPKLDDAALAQALKSSAYYIAALGSRKNHSARLERLACQGFGASTLERIHGPAGLDIGAANPAEIALSIAAQMTAAWRGKI